MLIVPLQATENQNVQTSLGGQAVQLNVYAKQIGPASLPATLFMDVLVNNSIIVSGVICQDRNRIVRDVYLGFVGDLSFADTQGTSNPVYTGLGTQYLLFYLETADLAAMGFAG